MSFDALYAFALDSADHLVPGEVAHAEHVIVASAIARVVEDEPPIFKDDADKMRTASEIVAVGFREGALRARVVGDCTESKPGEPCKGRPRSYCFLQIHLSNGGSDAMNEDLTLCVRVAHRLMRTSARICGKAPLAWYAEGGEHACESARAVRISNDRMAIAARLYRRRSDSQGANNTAKAKEAAREDK